MPDATTRQAEVTARLLDFIRESFPPEDLPAEFDETTPLLNGILDSLKTAMLLNYIRDDLGTPVPPTRIDTRNFHNVASISEMVYDLAAAPGSRAET